MRRSPIRIMLAALVVAIAPSVWTSALATVPAVAATQPALTATATPGAVVYPGSAVVSGMITSGVDPLGGVSLSLLSRPSGTTQEWSAVDATLTDAAGGYRFTVAPSVSTDYRVVTADQAAQADTRLAVKPRVTSSFPESLWLGGSVVLRGAVRPAHPGGTVVIHRRVDGVWQPLASVTLDADSRFALRWTPAEFGYYRLRARMDADADHAAGMAKSELVIVNRPNAHRVPMRYAHYIVIVRHEYRLYYYEHGRMVRRFDVALGRPGYRTPLGYYRVYGKRKPAGGALGACAMFYRRAGGIAIHGTNQPELIRRPAPRAYSHGCARMLNGQALWLYARVPVGTRIHNLR